MNKIDELVKLLERLNSGEINEALKAEATEMVSKIDPLELSIAEQKLIERGTNPQDLRNLCEIHMDVLKSELDKLKLKINKDHMLTTLINEHDEILKLLTKLESINNSIQKINTCNKNQSEFDELLKVTENIIDAENHHKREENVLFPELEIRNITGPTRIMRMEHDLLRAKKHEIRKLALEVETIGFDEFKKALDDAAKYLVFNMRDHIYKENHILYPTSLETLTDKDLWKKMKKACDEIGYCSFTPGK